MEAPFDDKAFAALSVQYFQVVDGSPGEDWFSNANRNDLPVRTQESKEA
jgi:hypothetical protein